MNTQRYAYAILFTQGPRLSDLFRERSWSQRLRIIRRRPKVVYMLAGSWLAGKLIGSTHRHCLPADKSVVMDYGYRNLTFVPTNRLDRRHHNLNGYVVFTSPMIPDWTQYEGKKKSLVYATWGRVLMFLTRGRYQCENCTTVTRHWLACMGKPVPNRLWNPKLLLLWMTENGYNFIADKSSFDVGAIDSGTGSSESSPSR